MKEFAITSTYVSQSLKTLQALSEFFGFYKGLHDDLSMKLNFFYPTAQITEQNESIRRSIDKVTEISKAKSLLHAEISK